MTEARSYLRGDGRVLLTFGTSGDLDYLLTLIDRSGFNKKVISELDLARDAGTVRHVYRLTVSLSPAATA